MEISRFARLSYVCGALLWLVVPVLARSAPVRPSVDAFFANNAFADAVLSPGGRYLAVRTGVKGRRDALAVIDLDTRKPTSLIGNDDDDIGEFQWVNDTRLMYNVYDSTVAPGEQFYAPGLFAIDADGSHFIRLASRTGYHGARQPWNTFMFEQQGPQDSAWRFVTRPAYAYDDKYERTYMLRLDTETGDAEAVEVPYHPAQNFMLDFQGRLRLAIGSYAAGQVLTYLDPATNEWRALVTTPTRNIREQIKPLGFGPDGTLYVIANAGENLATLRTLDVKTGELSKEALVATPGYDFNGSLVYNRKKVLGVRLTTDAEANIWFDPALQEIQKAVNKALPSTINLLTVAADPDAPRVLVESYSDRQPRTFSVFNVKLGEVELSAAPYPQILPAAMGRQEPIKYTARDGMPMTGLLTLPPDSSRKNLPMVVLVHGGPFVRGASWGWSPESQFLASRGYAVLEVEFRGSAGFGADHYEAGFKQWGLAMQNDIADGTRWAIAQGIADPQRICIAGASYGGYATLMGLLNDPELYRCGFEWLGVTDIEMMYTGIWWDKSDATDSQLEYSMPFMIGDPVKDAAQLRVTSPLRQAARITQPLLLAYGKDDRRVPLVHGRRFYAAVTRTNKQVEWLEYRGEGHGWRQEKNRIDFWQRVESFLYRHLGNATAVPAIAP